MKANALRQSALRKGGSMKGEDVFIPHTSSFILSSSGFTLLEVMMATAILGIVLASTTMYLVSMSDSVASEMSQSALEINSTRTLSNLVDDLVDGWAYVDGYGEIASSYVKVKRPVDFDDPPDGMLDEIADHEAGVRSMFGVSAPWGNEHGYVEYGFVEQDTLNETALGDINGDGHIGDVFARGWLYRKWHGDVRHGPFPNEDGLTQNLLWTVIQVGTSGNYGGDIDEDGNNDPIFSMPAGGKVLTISLWVYGRDSRGRNMIHNVRTSVALRNQQ